MANIKSRKSGATSVYREMFKNSENLCKSQVYNKVYTKLDQDNRLSRFIAAVQYCSVSGLDMNQTVDFILKAFPGYLKKKEFNVECFKDMIKNNDKISVAWGYGATGDAVTNIMIKNKALDLVEKTDSMEDIEIYNRVFNAEELNTKGESTVINFNLEKKD